MSTKKQIDHIAYFEESKSKFETYPENLVRTEAFRHTLESYRILLNSKKVFHESHRSLRWIDLYENADAYTPSPPLDTLDRLNVHLDEEDAAPLWRMVFLESVSSRGQLGCTKEQLTTLLTYYQVMPTFLDFILTFSIRARPLAHAIFRQENYLETNSPEFSLPALGRSGIQIQHAFNLLSVERAGHPDEKNQWPLRQIALYHSFDVTNGRCRWIILKGNQLMRRRIFSATKQHRCLKAKEITSPETSFVAALQVQTIVTEWCAESWAEYIDYLEEDVATSSVGGNAAPVDEMVRPANIEAFHLPRRGSTWESQVTSSRMGSARWVPRFSSDLLATIRRLSGLETGVLTTRQDEASPGTVEATAGLEDDEGDDSNSDKLPDLEQEFSFSKFQRLTLLAQELEQAMVVIEQNRGVLRSIGEHYRSVVNSHGFATHMKKHLYDSDLAVFFGKLRNIEGDLDRHYSRLRTLSRALEKSKEMFTTVWQYKGGRVSDYFASSTKISTDRMEVMTLKMHDIAVRTEQETVSMHVITVFTLIFLPGTFIAVWTLVPRLRRHILTWCQTLFSSGVIHWDDDGSLGTDWVLRQGGLRLFFSISLPMMVIIVTAWLLLYLYMRRKRQQEKQRLLLPLTEKQSSWGVMAVDEIFTSTQGPANVV
ncbi:hypothetical protein GGR54DRAFT_94494 [Hypoxylon sp. NC1633]|nr:hypothetical protein GGR54DRAFT_94494 [Hypoxylon sp. NC1633]